MEYRDYYGVLGVRRDASHEEIRRRYRRLARRYHPDVSREADAETRFKEVNEAYEVLKDEGRRAAYDRVDPSWRSGRRPGPRPGTRGYTHGQFSEFFETLFGRGGRPRRGGAAPGPDQRSKVLVSLEDAYHGATRTVHVEAPELDGEGRLVTATRSLRVQIPRGVTHGQQIRLAGQGGSGASGGARGDLYLEVDLQVHPLYRVEGRDTFLELPITPWEAALGETIAVPTLGGPVDLKIPSGTQSGSRLRLRGRGLPGRRPGDQYVVLSIATPPADSEAARSFYRQMAAKMPYNPRARIGL